MFDEVRANKIKSVFLITLFFGIIILLGLVFGAVYGSNYFGIGLAVVVSTVYFLVSWFSGDKMILKMSGARPVTKKEYPHLFHTIEGLAVAAGLPTPKAYVIDDTALNAFATGRSPEHASITVTTGLMNKLNRQELEGVIAHEMSHIKNFDIRFMMLTALLVGIITLLSDFLLRTFLWGGHGRSRNSGKGGGATAILIVVGLLLAILAPIIGQMIKLAISRKREYMADASGAILTRYPPGLASALNKIKGDPDPLVDKANKATAHLFINTPFRKNQKGVMFASLFSTHPPIDDRIKKLKEM
ncbi:M48 family metallopeptidase [Candidatus Woesearchaeota archaeon]|nr:M48 family metallopeptidase [Candidatus Woesearchaeota archaeon]